MKPLVHDVDQEAYSVAYRRCCETLLNLMDTWANDGTLTDATGSGPALTALITCASAGAKNVGLDVATFISKATVIASETYAYQGPTLDA